MYDNFLIITSSENIKEKTKNFISIPTLKEAKLTLLKEQFSKIFIFDLHPAEVTTLNSFIEALSTHPNLSSLQIVVDSLLSKYLDDSLESKENVNKNTTASLIKELNGNKLSDENLANHDLIDLVIDLSAKSLADIKLNYNLSNNINELIELYTERMKFYANSTI